MHKVQQSITFMKWKQGEVLKFMAEAAAQGLDVFMT